MEYLNLMFVFVYIPFCQRRLRKQTWLVQRYKPRSRKAGKATRAPAMPDIKVATSTPLMDILSRLAIPVPVVSSKIVTKSKVPNAIETDNTRFFRLNPKADKTKKRRQC